MCSPGCCSGIVATNSARPFVNPAAILEKKAVREILGRGVLSIVEYGAGNLRNAFFLQQLGHEVAAVEISGTVDRFRSNYSRFDEQGGRLALWDKADGMAKFKGKHDVAIMTFVLETICDEAIRVKMLQDCRSRLRRGGRLILSVRGHQDVVTANGKGVACSDGFRTPARTFIRGFDLKELQKLLVVAGFSRMLPLHKPKTISPELLHVIAQQ